MRIDSGIQAIAGDNAFHAVPNVTVTFSMVAFSFNNTTAAAIDVTLTDGDDKVIQPTFSLAAGALYLVPTFLKPTSNGCKWKANAVGVNGQVWGYQ